MFMCTDPEFLLLFSEPYLLLLFLFALLIVHTLHIIYFCNIMAHLYKDDKGPAYIDKEWITRPDEYRKALEQSATVYIGNLAFFTTEEQIWELFSKIGEIKRIIMGLDSVKKTPCGFCFVE